MPVFISYSHTDKEFAETLAIQLIAHKAHVWLDKWELHVGDSLIQKIQGAVQGASALIIVLSKTSVASEWCKKELSGGLLRELEEKRVVVLPDIIEDCEIPIFVREKLYADFRTNFDDGLQAILDSIARVTNDSLGRIDEPEFHVDWAIDWGTFAEDFIALRLTLVEQAVDQPYSCLTVINIIADDTGTQQYKRRQRNKSRQFAQFKVIDLLANSVSEGQEIRPNLSDQFEKTSTFPLNDIQSGAVFLVSVSARRLGEDTGRDILLNVGGQVQIIRDLLMGVIPETQEA